MDQDQEAAIVERVAQRNRKNSRLLVALLVVSLLLHFVTLTTLNRFRLAALDQASALRTQVVAIQDDILTFDLPIERTVPVQATIPVRQNLTIPVSTTVSLDQIVNVPVRTPFGSTDLRLPVNIDVPVNTEVPIAISETVTISTAVNLNLTVPLEVPVEQTPLAPYLRTFEQMIDTFIESF